MLALWLAKEDLEWRFDSSQPSYVPFLIVLGVVAFVVVSYLLEPRTEGRSRVGRILLGALRVLAILIAVAILFHPVERKETRETKEGYVVVAIDKSRSMSLKDREGDERYRMAVAQAIGVPLEQLRDLDRLGRVKRALGNQKSRVLEKLAERNKIKLYTFDATRNRLADVEKLDHDSSREERKDAREDGVGGVSSGAPTLSPEASLARAQQEVQAIEADGPATALGDSLQKILTDLRSEKVAALVLLTDGRSNAGSLQAEVVAGRYGKKSIPIYAVGVGDPNPPKDLSIEAVDAPEVTIAGDVVNFSVTVRAQGYEQPRDVDVDLYLDGQVVKHDTVRAVGGTGPDAKPERQQSITWKPEKEGELNIELRIPSDEQEITFENNKAFHHLRVVASKIKVLYVEGYPRWEYRFLKNALVRDSKIEVQCLLLDADPGFPQESTRGLPPLKAFPSREELFQYHVVIFGDVNPQATGFDGRPVFPEGALENVKEFVADMGGGFLMISGEVDSPRRYASTPIASLLPVQVDDQDAGARTEYTEPWHPRLTREGLRGVPSSRILLLEKDEEKNRALWEGPTALPGFFWHYRALKAKPLAHVLAEHPTDRNQSGNDPIWAWQYFKSGTVFWSAVDEAWRWRAGVGDRYPYRLYSQILRFLVEGRFQRSKRFVVTTDKAKYTVGEEARITATVKDRSYRLVTDKTQEVIVETPEAKTEKLELKALEGQDGRFEGRYKPVKVGVYKVSIDPGTTGSEGDVAPRLFEVKFPSIELEEPRMDKEGLEAVATASGGKFLKLDELGDLPEKIGPMTETVAASANERELWDNNRVLAAFAALLILEWIGRKVARLL